MTNNNQDAARQGFVDALASGQHVPVTMNPFAGRDPINLLTSSNTNMLNGQPVLPAGAPTPQRELSDREVRQWIFDHIRGGDTRGDTVFLQADIYLDHDDMLFKRIESKFGKQVLLLKDSEARFMEQMRADTTMTEDQWEPILNPNETPEEIEEKANKKQADKESPKKKSEETKKEGS